MTEIPERKSWTDFPKKLLKSEKKEANLWKKIENYQSNRILNSYANVVAESFEAQDVTLYVWDKPFVKFGFELEALRMSFSLLGVKHDVVSTPYKHIYLGDLPIVQADDLFMQSSGFLTLLFKMIYDESNILEYTSNKRIFTLCENELKRIAEYFMWAEPSTGYLSFRDPYWLAISPIHKVEHNYWLQTKKIALANTGLGSMEEALEKAAGLFSELNHVLETYNGFYIGLKEDDPRYYINNVVVYCALAFIIENQPFSPLTKMLMEQFPKLFQWAKEFDGNYQILANKYAANTLSIKLREIKYTHSYKQRKTEEGPKKKLTRRNVITTAVIAAMFAVYLYKRD